MRGLRSVYVMETGCMSVCVCVWGGGGVGAFAVSLCTSVLSNYLTE